MERLKIVSLTSSIFSSVMSTVILSIVLPDLSGTLHVSLAEVQVRNVFFFAIFAGLLPFFGKQADRGNARTQLQLGLGAFILSMLGSFAALRMESWPLFLTFQTALALADSIMVPATVRLLRVSFPPEKTGWAFGWFSASLAAASLAGPALTGLIYSYIHWSWILIFLAAVPTVSLAAVSRAIDKTQAQSTAPNDLAGLPGSLALAGIVLSAQFVSDVRYAWIFLAISMLCFAANEIYSLPAQRIFPESLWRNRAYLSACVSVILLFIVANGLILFAPAWLRVSHGYSAKEVATLLFLSSGMIVIAGPYSGRWIDRSPALAAAAGLLLAALAMAGFLAAPSGAPLKYFLGCYAIMGLSSALLSPSINTFAMSSVPREQTGAYMGVFQFLQFSSGAFAAGFFGEAPMQSIFITGAAVYAALFALLAVSRIYVR